MRPTGGGALTKSASQKEQAAKDAVALNRYEGEGGAAAAAAPHAIGAVESFVGGYLGLIDPDHP